MAKGTALVPTVEAGLPAELMGIAERLGRYAENARGAFAHNTERAIRADTALFAQWAAQEGRTSLPAAPDTIAAFIDAMAVTRAPASVRRYVSSLAHVHRAAGINPLPTADNAVRLALKRLHREKGRRQKQAHGVTRELVDRMLRVAGTATIDLRNKALLAVAYDTMTRRSELVLLLAEDLTRGEEADATILLRKSKTDQEGEGADLWIAPDTLRHLEAWLTAASITEGPIFRGVHRNGRILEPLNPAEVARIFKRMAEAASLDPQTVAAISGHSTRVGSTQDMFALGFELTDVMQQGRWKTPAMPARYGSRLQARRGAAARLARLQDRA